MINLSSLYDTLLLILLTVVFKDGFHLPVEVTHGYVGKFFSASIALSRSNCIRQSKKGFLAVLKIYQMNIKLDLNDLQFMILHSKYLPTVGKYRLQSVK